MGKATGHKGQGVQPRLGKGLTGKGCEHPDNFPLDNQRITGKSDNPFPVRPGTITNGGQREQIRSDVGQTLLRYLANNELAERNTTV